VPLNEFNPVHSPPLNPSKLFRAEKRNKHPPFMVAHLAPTLKKGGNFVHRVSKNVCTFPFLPVSSNVITSPIKSWYILFAETTVVLISLHHFTFRARSVCSSPYFPRRGGGGGYFQKYLEASHSEILGWGRVTLRKISWTVSQ